MDVVHARHDHALAEDLDDGGGADPGVGVSFGADPDDLAVGDGQGVGPGEVGVQGVDAGVTEDEVGGGGGARGVDLDIVLDLDIDLGIDLGTDLDIDLGIDLGIDLDVGVRGGDAGVATTTRRAQEAERQGQPRDHQKQTAQEALAASAQRPSQDMLQQKGSAPQIELWQLGSLQPGVPLDWQQSPSPAPPPPPPAPQTSQLSMAALAQMLSQVLSQQKASLAQTKVWQSALSQPTDPLATQQSPEQFVQSSGQLVQDSAPRHSPSPQKGQTPQSSGHTSQVSDGSQLASPHSLVHPQP